MSPRLWHPHHLQSSFAPQLPKQAWKRATVPSEGQELKKQLCGEKRVSKSMSLSGLNNFRNYSRFPCAQIQKRILPNPNVCPSQDQMIRRTYSMQPDLRAGPLRNYSGISPAARKSHKIPAAVQSAAPKGNARWPKGFACGFFPDF